MLRFKTLDDRQILIEEIYSELEAILLQKEGNAKEEEEEDIKENYYIEEEEEDDTTNEKSLEKKRMMSIQQVDPSEMTDIQRKKYFFNLLSELEQKKIMLEQSLSQIGKMIRNNHM